MRDGNFTEADAELLSQVANQIAIALENALAFREIEELKDKLAKEKLYLEEEIRTEHNFGDIIGTSSALKSVLKQVEIVATTDATVLIFGETGTGSGAGRHWRVKDGCSLLLGLGGTGRLRDRRTRISCDNLGDAGFAGAGDAALAGSRPSRSALQ